MNPWDTPPFSAHAAPVLWTPNASTGERFVAIVLVRYDAPVVGEVAAPVTFSPRQLKAMIGSRRASSALGILHHVSEFMRDQILSGSALDNVIAPFDGFAIGKLMRVRGYSSKQVVDTAIRTLSAFGSRESYDEDEETPQRNSVPTRQFLRSLRSVFAREDEERRGRFNKNVTVGGSAPMTIDYAHEKHLVQVTSLPQSEPHLIALQKEAESKILELDITATLLRSDRAPTHSSLLINTASLERADSREARKVANELLERLRFMSEQKSMTLLQARDPFEAAKILDQFEREEGLQYA
ncbi:hypothetical protein F3J20_16160 [Paraburkholderia sp. Cy-641]|uniref:hypothetical protein n=1 Tax=Paraburkholderia sp. Cy-641 TaxID=2608337 RepID=UPI00141DC09F|nr:hypothetical protein [Paraburkholderia sp. Cy-641]NIF78902.1 hypothetical protein [Paraburkholderia sp. Cy-641]